MGVAICLVPILGFVNDMGPVAGIREPRCEEFDPIHLNHCW